MDHQGTPCARLCHIVKWDDFDGYGFNLHAEKGKSGQFIGKVDEGSPSEAAGLRQGDRIIEVNEINIANESHKQVVERIKAFPTETKLLVVDQQADDYFKANNVPIKASMPGVKLLKTPERSPASIAQDERDAAAIAAGIQLQSGDTHSIGSSASDAQHENGSSSSGAGNNGSTTRLDDDTSSNKSSSSAGKEQPQQQSNGSAAGLNLAMSAKELRAKLAMRKKYDPKKESLGFKDKFDIVQKL
ncbi:Na(+)/H(+) exchange regulatory cofactor NHE-RF1 [Nasonia vitripennis]|uniref:PDZ domain-containing protein n=1 Tax=Nasonia vitripennis TaxID=7425 RepID=A0A7M7G8R3_NASVI|nr:Na(+)/H(+) exchange regulatory cofactor NHE-RF1 [Nasonia vitripennis]